MNNIITKFNAYDFWAVMLPGVIFVATIILLFQWNTTNDISFYTLNSLSNIVTFVFISYFAGIILQEAGSIIQKWVLFHRGEPSDIFLSAKNKMLSKNQKSFFTRYILVGPFKNIDVESTADNRMVFNHMNAYLSIVGLSEKCDKIQALFGLSRGLLCSSLINLLFVASLWLFYSGNVYNRNILLSLLMCAIVSVILYRRTYRYATIRVKNVCQFYFTKLNQDNFQKIVKWDGEYYN